MSNHERRTETVDTRSMDRLARVLGAFDENLNFLSRQLNVVAYVEGAKIRVEGEAPNVTLAARVLSALVKLADTGEEIDEGRLTYCIEMAREGKTEEIAALSEGVVAVTAKGKQIKCKTVGQKSYVDAIRKNTVVFGVGPAGTGKTY